MKLKDKKALITGGSRSIGRAIALAFAADGADVVITYKSNEQEALKTVQAIEKLGQKAKAIRVDFAPYSPKTAL